MKSVMKGASYILAHTPDMVLHNGTTQTTERIVNPESEYLKELPQHLRPFDRALAYWPNQVYIGNKTPDDLAQVEQPWHDKTCDTSARYGRFGQIMPQEEFLLLMQACDVFDLVRLDKAFVAEHKPALEQNKILDQGILSRVGEGVERSAVEHFVNDQHAEPLYHKGQLVGCVVRAHEIDVNLSAHVMHENLVSKASSVLALLHAVKNAGIEKTDVDYVIDCSEEACGDMNQRGGGNFAKAAAEIAGLDKATGADTRAFCAGPAHAIVEAAALVSAGAYKCVVVTAGGCTAKLGMNGKDHVKKGLPILEDVVAGFSVVITRDDGVSPVFDLSILGRHAVGTGSAPQAVIGALVTEPLERAGLKVTDIDKFSPEMQNPDITKPAGAGDVPLSNYKMIAALAVKKGELQKADLAAFPAKHGLTGWAPTQGHIPSGVPYLGFAREDILSGRVNRAMIIGKGSLFLARMTNLFDGVSFVLQANAGEEPAEAAPAQPTAARPRIVLTGLGSEHGEQNAMEAARMAAQKGVDVYYIGTLEAEGITTVKAETEDEGHKQMERLMASGRVDGAVTMHYPFPIGVSTVGKVVTPARGREMFVATTTGTSSADRVEGMVRNALSGIIAAKASGIKDPTVGILNLDGARQTELALNRLKEGGYQFSWATSARADGGAVLRGNDVLQGTPDVLVCDSLTGNVLIKILSAYSTGGSFEATGYGYGPGIGKGYRKLIHIISRASGAPLIANALVYAADMVRGKLFEVAEREFAAAEKAGLEGILAARKEGDKPAGQAEEVKAPPAEPCTASIPGIEVMDLEDAAMALWKAGIYAETGMGCTGPLVMMSEANHDKALDILKKAGFIG